MGNYKKLASNSILFFAANFGSKILTFIMVPYYTYVLTTTEYGVVDIIVATVALVSPLVTLGMGDIVTLFLVRKEYSQKKIFTNSFFLLFFANICICILYPLISSIKTFENYAVYFFVLVIMQSLYSMLQCYARGCGKVISFAISGMMYTGVLVSLNIYFLTILKLEIRGYLLSMIFAYFVCSVYLSVMIGMPNLIEIKLIDKQYIKNLLRLSLPLLPTAILWWLMNICDKYTILFYMSASANGLYTVAHKVPTILATIYSVFQQAWQLTSLEMKTKEERSEMYSKMFEILSCILFVVTSCLIMASKIYVVVFCESTYRSAWLITPLLLISAIFNALSGFFESNFFLMKDTKAILKITSIGTLINFVLNMLLVPLIGLQGAALATCVGFIYMTIHKMLGTRKFTPLTIDVKRFLFAFVFIVLQSIITVVIKNNFIYLVGIIFVLVLIFMYKDIIWGGFNKIICMVKTKLNNE